MDQLSSLALIGITLSLLTAGLGLIVHAFIGLTKKTAQKPSATQQRFNGEPVHEEGKESIHEVSGYRKAS